jgi:hypothetical protein
MNKKLLLFWQNTETCQWFTVGLLEFIKDEYSFRYSRSAHEAHKAGDFIPFGVMKDFSKTYTSKTLFPLFKNRLLDKSRPEYTEYLAWLGLTRESATDMDELSLSGGVRATDQLQILPYPESESGQYCVDFFVHGIRHIGKNGADRVAQLEAGEELLLVREDDNEFDQLALAVSTQTQPVIVGYCPRFFAKDFRRLLDLNEEYKTIKLRVSKVNMGAPLQYRLRCRLEAVWVDGFSTFADEEFGFGNEYELLKVAN